MSKSLSAQLHDEWLLRVSAVRDTRSVTILEASPLTYGEVFTRRWVVDTILDLVGYTSDRPLYQLRVVEPSVGSGAFLAPIIERLLESALRDEVPLDSLGDAIRGFDLLGEHVETCVRSASDALCRAGLGAESADGIARTWLRQADFLLDENDLTADFVVGNPPYIRSDDLDKVTEDAYRRRWATMRGRCDIYVGFYERSLRMLADDGRVGFICADRWMRNAYGAALRDFVTSQYSVDCLWQLHDVDAFEAVVSAYPAITILSNRPQGSVVVADTDAGFNAESAAQLSRFVCSSAEGEKGVGYRAHRTPSWFSGSGLWPAGDPERIALLEDLNERFGVLENPAHGTRIGIGVATGADKIFIAHKDIDVEQDRKLPLVMADDIRSGTFAWREKILLNPWNLDGSLVDLADYPKLHGALLQVPGAKERFVARKNPASWHRTIDKVNPSLIGRPKLLLQDMKATIQPVLDTGGFYPHHNLYYIVSDIWDLEVLGGLMLSRVAQSFIEAYGVKMRGGTLRFQAQYLRKIRVPDPRLMSEDVSSRLVRAFRLRDVDAATRAAEAAYGLPEGVL